MNKKDNLLKHSYITQTHGFVDVTHKRDAWRAFADEIGGEFKILHTVDRVIEKLRIRVNIENTDYEICESATHPLKLSFSMSFPHKLAFTLAPNEGMDKFLSKIFSGSIQTDHEDFNKKFILKGQPKMGVKRIFSDIDLCREIIDNHIFSMSGNYKKPHKQLIILLLSKRETDSVEKLISFFETGKMITGRISALG